MVKRLLTPLFILAFLAVGSCTIEPPLKIASRSVAEMTLAEIDTSLELVWGVDADWQASWWYGWDDTDIDLWGEIAYPDPSCFEARFYCFGEDPAATAWKRVDRTTLYERRFLHGFEYGYHDMLLWTNIDSKDNTQVLLVDESDPDNIRATTSSTRISYTPPGYAAALNAPEIFYAARLDKMYISRDPADYDYFDSERNAWVKVFETEFRPLVYIYLVQVAVYNNNGRVVDLNDWPSLTALADGVTINSGHTSSSPVAVAYPMRLKKGLPARDGRLADIFGGKLTTFGLCDMDPVDVARSPLYAGLRTGLANTLALPLKFSNSTDSLYLYDVTPQLQAKARGGVITIEIDADTLKVPFRASTPASAFDPVIAPEDSVTHEFQM